MNLVGNVALLVIIPSPLLNLYNILCRFYASPNEICELHVCSSHIYNLTMLFSLVVANQILA